MTNQSSQAKKKPSLKWRLIRIVMLCWFFPVIMIAISMGNLASESINEKTLQSYKDHAAFNARISTERLDMAVDASKLTSYDYEIKKVYHYFRTTDESFGELYATTQKYLSRRFRSDDRFGYAIMWFWDSPVEYNCYTFNESIAKVGDIANYWRDDHKQIMEIARGLDTGVAFVSIGGKLYLVRNVMDGQLRPMAVLVLCLNDDYFFGDFGIIPWQSGYNIYIDSREVYLGGVPSEHSTLDFLGDNQQHYHAEDGKPIIHGSKRGAGYNLSYVLDINPSGILNQLSAFRFVLGAMLLVLLPLIGLAIRFFYINVSHPVEQMIIGAREIEIGNFGYQLRKKSRNREFDYLEQSFNEMSMQLEELFHRIYDEELALRDAKIKALQSQINPHFLNNTLEIINWESRMSGNVKVSKMIEALSTMLDAAMARDGRKTVRLSEEMMYVDAYFYIISERLGKRLTITRDVDNSLLENNVPRLILQPIIENAVEHGITPRQQGAISLRIAREDNWIILQVFNDGELSDEDAAEISRLLSDGDITPLSSSRSIGIRNVHQRLRILYGTGSGLTIVPTVGGRVAATIRIPLDSQE